MISINKISVEYKSTALFGIIALLLSFLVGIVAGVTWGVVILRSLVLAAVFAAIGYGTCAVFKRYVPEMYQILSSASHLSAKGAGQGDAAAPAAGDESADLAAIDDEPEAAPAGPAIEAEAGKFKEFEKEKFDRYSSVSGGVADLNTAEGKLGKHILEKEKLAKYEPKVMAQAVRTMMSKD